MKKHIEQLEKEGKVVFTQDGVTVSIWETEQGEDNVRGEDFMNFMYSIYDVDEFAEDGEDAAELDGGLCNGTPADAVEMAIS